MAETVAVAAAEAEQRLDRWLRKRFPGLTQGALQRLLRSGQIRVDGKRVEANHRLAAGQEVRLPPNIESLAAGERPKPARETAKPATAEEAAALQARVLHRDRWLIALDKPAGLAVQGGSGQARPLDHLLGALVGPEEEAPRLTHRLDRDTSGVLLLARSAAAARALTAAFRDRAARKLYWAIVAGRPQKKAGRIDLPLAKGGGRQERMEVDPRHGEPAETLYAVAQSRPDGKASFLVLSPLTGRTHQLRVHMAALGHPILGDGKYGGRGAHPAGLRLPGQLLLHAAELAVPHPDDGTTLRVSAPPPEHFLAALKALGLDPRTAERGFEELMKRGA